MQLASIQDSVADPGSGAFLTPENVYFGSRITNPYFLELSDKFLGKKFYNSLKNGPNFFLQYFKKIRLLQSFKLI